MFSKIKFKEEGKYHSLKISFCSVKVLCIKHCEWNKGGQHYWIIYNPCIFLTVSTQGKGISDCCSAADCKVLYIFDAKLVKALAEIMQVNILMNY